jgi:hypothetical protein
MPAELSERRRRRCSSRRTWCVLPGHCCVWRPAAHAHAFSGTAQRARLLLVVSAGCVWCVGVRAGAGAGRRSPTTDGALGCRHSHPTLLPRPRPPGITGIIGPAAAPDPGHPAAAASGGGAASAGNGRREVRAPIIYYEYCRARCHVSRPPERTRAVAVLSRLCAAAAAAGTGVLARHRCAAHHPRAAAAARRRRRSGLARRCVSAVTGNASPSACPPGSHA